MQTLGLADSTPRSEGRLKSLFWPSIQNAWDVDSLGQQGFWICVMVGAMSLLLALMQGQWISGSATALFFLLSGIGVGEKSVVAATMVFAVYTLDLVFSMLLATGGFPVIRMIVFAVLFSNLRGTWLASRWNRDETPGVADDKPMRFNENWRDKLVDQMPRAAWPKLRIVYFVFAFLYLAVFIVGAGMLLAKGRSPVHPSPEAQPDAVVRGL